MFLTLLLATVTAHAACPSPYDAADCLDGNGHAVCSMNGSEYTCTPDFGGTGSEMFATYDPSHATCAQDYCAFGLDSDDNAFCCEVAPSGMTQFNIAGGAGNDHVSLHYPGSAMDDYGTTNGFTVVVLGSGGDDAISGSNIQSGTYREYLHGGAGDDDIYGQGGYDEIYGDAGYDNLTALAYGYPVVYGGADDDAIQVGPFGGTAYGQGGNDLIQGGVAADELHGGDGDDVLIGGGGDDFIWGDADVDSLHGGDGLDTLYGGYGNDVLCGDDDDDSIYGEGGSDTLFDLTKDDLTAGGADGGDACYDASNWQGSCESHPTVMSYPCWY